MARKKLAIILGIRPDVIRASLVLNSIRKRDDIDGAIHLVAVSIIRTISRTSSSAS